MTQMQMRDVMQVLEAIAPLHAAESWDNVGLLVGSSVWPAERIMLTIDLTDAVLQEAIAFRANLIVAYHPPIFQPIKSLTDRTTKERIALEAARHGIGIYSPHTALDAAPGGVNDWLAQGIGVGDTKALHPLDHLPRTEECKIVTFCPEKAVDDLRNALATVGAGRIGDYHLCSFELRGAGTFHGSDPTNPKIGKRGELERIEEVRLEMVCPRDSLALAVLSLRQFHPYEEPPIEIYALQPRPKRDTGPGRRLVLDRPISMRVLVERLKKHLGVQTVQVAPASAARRRLHAVGVCAGAGGSLLQSAVEQGCDVFITGEMRHHDVLDAQSRGCAVILAGHTNTERGYLKVLRTRMREALKDCMIEIAKKDGDPLKTM